jgi:hypothetical protein
MIKILASLESGANRNGQGPTPTQRPDAINETTVDIAGLEHALRAAVRGEVRFDDGSRALYATDASNYRQVPSPSSFHVTLRTLKRRSPLPNVWVPDRRAGRWYGFGGQHL